MEAKNKELKEEKTPRWLKTIQLNSWEAELLISALVLYALFQIPDFLKETSLEYFDRDSRLHTVFEFIIMAVRLLSCGYIMHILVRGIWVASVGLSYVFPKGVDQTALRFKGKFKKELSRSGSLVKTVLRLEELSSIIYGISFIFFGTLLGFTTLIFSFVYFLELVLPLINTNANFGVVFFSLVLFYLLLCVIVFIDFLTNGYFRRKEWSADWFYVVARIFRVVTLSFLYRRSLLVLISNIKGWKSYLVPFIVLSVISGFMYAHDTIEDNVRDSYYMRSEAGDYNSVNYENTRRPNSYLVATIQSDIVNQRTLKVFLKDIGAFGGVYATEGKLQKTKWDLLKSDSVSAFFNERLLVHIDDTRIDSIQWFKTQHPANSEFGFTSFIDISELKRGPHFLKIGIDTTGLRKASKSIVERENYSLRTISNIYFIYEKP